MHGNPSTDIYLLLTAGRCRCTVECRVSREHLVDEVAGGRHQDVV